MVADRIDPGIISAAISGVASVISTGGGDGSHSTYEMPNGARFNKNDCWQVLTSFKYSNIKTDCILIF